MDYGRDRDLFFIMCCLTPLAVIVLVCLLLLIGGYK